MRIDYCTAAGSLDHNGNDRCFTLAVNNFPFDTADEEIRSLFSRVGPVRTFRYV